MFVARQDMQTEVRTAPRGGAGDVRFCPVLPPAELPAVCTLCHRVTLQKGQSIGKHCHDGDAEILYMLQGKAQLDDDGVMRTLCPGDAAMTRRGAFHAIANLEEEDATFLAVILSD